MKNIAIIAAIAALILLVANIVFAQEVSLAKAKKIFGENFLGPEAIEKAFGFKPRAIPPIPFSEDELQHAKKLGMILVLQINKLPDGEPLTMRQIYKLLNNYEEPEETRTYYGNDGKVYGQLSNLRDKFFTEEVPKYGWKLVKELSVTANQNYLEQTKTVLNYLVTEVYCPNMPPEYQAAIDSFLAREAGLRAILEKDWPKAAKALMELKINDWFRETAVEVFYRCVLYEKQNQARILPDVLIWTKEQDRAGGIVFIGKFDGKSVFTNGFWPYDKYGDLISSFCILR